MRVLVTGAGGYLGHAVVAALHSAGHSPVAMVRERGMSIPGAADVRVADLLDPAALRQAVDGVDAVCHLAGLTRARESLREPLRYFRVNTCGTIALLDAMADAGVPGMVFGSTGSIYGTPDRQPMDEQLSDDVPHPYAGSKLAAELAITAQAQSGQLGAIIVRLLNVAGGKDPDPTRIVPRALAAAAGNGPLEINGDGTAVRDYLHIEDAAAAFVASVDRIPVPGTTMRYNVGSGQGTSVNDIVSAVERVTRLPVPVAHKPPTPEPQALVNDPILAMAELVWSPLRSDIDSIVGHAWSARSKRFEAI